MVRGKKGISGVIASVILIALVVGLGVIIWSVVKNLVEDDLESAGSCFEARDSVVINSRYTCINVTGGELQFGIDVEKAGVEEASVIISGAEGSKKITLSREAASYSYLKKYGGTYGEDSIVLPGEDEGYTYIVNLAAIGVENPTSIKVSPMMNGKQCEYEDVLVELDNCALFDDGSNDNGGGGDTGEDEGCTDNDDCEGDEACNANGECISYNNDARIDAISCSNGIEVYIPDALRYSSYPTYLVLSDTTQSIKYTLCEANAGTECEALQNITLEDFASENPDINFVDTENFWVGLYDGSQVTSEGAGDGWVQLGNDCDAMNSPPTGCVDDSKGYWFKDTDGECIDCNYIQCQEEGENLIPEEDTQNLISSHWNLGGVWEEENAFGDDVITSYELKAEDDEIKHGTLTFNKADFTEGQYNITYMIHAQNDNLDTDPDLTLPFIYSRMGTSIAGEAHYFTEVKEFSEIIKCNYGSCQLKFVGNTGTGGIMHFMKLKSAYVLSPPQPE